MRCILCHEMPHFCCLEPSGAAMGPVPARAQRTGPVSPVTEAGSWVMDPIQPPSHSSRWEIVPSTRTRCHRVLTTRRCSRKHHHHPYWPSAEMSTGRRSRRLCASSLRVETLLCDGDGRHLQSPASDSQPAHSLYCRSLMAAL